MSQNINGTLEVKKFESEVHQLFQEKPTAFADISRYRRITDSNAVQFPVLGKSPVSAHVVGTPVVTSNQTATAVTVTVSRYSTGQYTDVFLQSEINFDAKREAAMSIAMALGRKETQIGITALAAGTYTSQQVLSTISGSADGLRFASFTEASRLLDRVANGHGDKVMLIHSDGWHHMAAADAASVASSDYVTARPYMTGRGFDFYGFKVVTIGELDDETGLPLNSGTDIRSNYAYFKNALGMVVNKSPEINISFENSHVSYLVTGVLSAGAGIIDNTGIMEVLTDQSP